MGSLGVAPEEGEAAGGVRGVHGGKQRPLGGGEGDGGRALEAVAQRGVGEAVAEGEEHGALEEPVGKGWLGLDIHPPLPFETPCSHRLWSFLNNVLISCREPTLHPHSYIYVQNPVDAPSTAVRERQWQLCKNVM